MNLKKILLYVAMIAGGLLTVVGYPALALFGRVSLMFLVGWVAMFLFLVPVLAYGLFVEEIGTVRDHRRIVIGSCILLVICALGSSSYVVLFLDWDRWITFPTKNIYSPFLLQSIFWIYSSILFFRLVFMEEAEKYRERRERERRSL